MSKALQLIEMLFFFTNDFQMSLGGCLDEDSSQLFLGSCIGEYASYQISSHFFLFNGICTLA